MEECLSGIGVKFFGLRSGKWDNDKGLAIDDDVSSSGTLSGLVSCV